jgi:hypothetical protein
MNHISAKTNPEIIKQGKARMVIKGIESSSKSDLLAKGIATAVVASTIIQTGEGIVSVLAKDSFVISSLDIGVGYFAHKHRRKIISIANRTAKQSKDFALRQKENLEVILADSQEDMDASKQTLPLLLEQTIKEKFLS